MVIEDEGAFEPEHREPTRLDRIRTTVRRRRRAIRDRVRHARALWQERHANTVAAYVYAYAEVLTDHPRMRNLIDVELRERLDAVPLPLGWLVVDARWALGNVWRAIRGREPLRLPYEVVTEVRIEEQNAAARFDFYLRGPDFVCVIAERRRKPVQQ